MTDLKDLTESNSASLEESLKDSCLCGQECSCLDEPREEGSVTGACYCAEYQEPAY